ncbi:hypothetical protein GALMADRAFT_136239 [Galerina marginata CBS 339.88]|uniref:G-protein coupled receptors family 1 profile domain-containing protein n=1 Tax=Galerina marginata (strain CBS 339.88) TaxID=685588 RepID=A0A067TFQ8_GALM3|nr:hypothetical protein GALMADRAFT_136239 [Galerina marginata CBS 339.88]
MSSAVADGPTTSIQRSIIGSALNSTIMFTFLMGIYTMVYFFTVYLYLTRRQSKQRLVIAAISTLYALSILQLSLQWYLLQWSFATNGATREVIFASLVSSPIWFQLAVNIDIFAVLSLADALLIWRCFGIWNRSRRAIILPSVLLFSEIATVIIIGINDFRKLTTKELRQLNALEASLFFVSFSATLAATILIAYRIYSVAREGSRVHSRSLWGRFGHVVEIVIQSAATYSLALLLQAMIGVVPHNANSLWWFGLSDYGGALACTLAGLAPTVMVARVYVATGDKNHLAATQHLSEIQFQARSITHDETRDSILGMDRDITLGRGGKRDKA